MAIKFPTFDPVLVNLYGPLAVRWYGLAYVAGVILGLLYLKKLNKKPPSVFTEQSLDNLVMWIIISIILGGRLGYILFYGFSHYLAYPLEIFKTWNGGMSFHGGLLGVIIGLWCFSKKYKLRFWQVTDLVACVAPIGIALGRLGNFVNGELYGRVTTVSWGVIFPGGGNYPRHPSQIYESLVEGVIPLLVLGLIVAKTNARMKEGLLSGLFLFLYVVGRISMEVFREPDSHYGLIWHYFTMGQLLSVPLFICSLVIIYKALRSSKS